MNVMTSVESELVVIPDGRALAIFTIDQAIDPLLDRIRREIDAFMPDISTATGRKAVASMAYKVSRAKTYLDDAGKLLADEQKAIPRKIDACRKHIRDTLDAWRDEVRQPLTEWEQAESDRVEKHKAGLFAISQLAAGDIHMRASKVLRERLAEAEAITVGDACEEFASEYAIAKDAAIKALRAATEAADKREAEQTELARLRAEAAARQQKERDEHIAREAADRARREAEQKANTERLAVETAAKAEREAAERRELELRRAVEEEKRRAAETELRLKREETDRLAREAAETAKREANRKHRASINRTALAAMVDGGVPEAVAKTVIELIASKRIPAVSIAY